MLKMTMNQIMEVCQYVMSYVRTVGPCDIYSISKHLDERCPCVWNPIEAISFADSCIELLYQEKRLRHVECKQGVFYYDIHPDVKESE